ncbi:unnamed protein product [Brachionus calyciflorus]|uniref:Uncharacterized protein n=1 Tax=Brachionus calyciflorus TaxID=104777 RepID=A0A814H2I6_9BILA|nr:unnamed protein product [Brachionus calyciflorus]
MKKLYILLVSLIFSFNPSKQDDYIDDSTYKSVENIHSNYGSCEKPEQIKLEHINSSNTSSFTLNDYKLTRKVSDFKSTCFKNADLKRFFSFGLNRVFSFDLNDQAYIELKLKKKIVEADLYATITDTSCQIEYQCVPLFNEESNIIYLGSGNYNLIINAVLKKSDDISINFDLSIKAYLDPVFNGSFNSPIILDRDENFFSNQNIEKILVNILNKNSYRTKLDCSSESLSPSVVYSFEIPKEMELLLDIKLYSKSNKLDTVLGIVDYYNSSISVENWCNDDSDKIGGLSSYLSGILTHGKYKLIASGYDNETYGHFMLELKSYKIGSIGPIVLDDSMKKIFNGSFTHNKNKFICNCCNGKESIHDYIEIPLTVPQGKTMIGFIKVYGANKKNKLDTFIEIRDEYLESYFESGNLCNDDSSIVGGLSSFLNVLLRSGDYKLVIGSLDSKRSANFTLEFNF